MAATDEELARIDVSEDARPTRAIRDDGGRSILYLALGALLVAVLGAGTFYALSSGSHSTKAQRDEDLPVVRADERPFKVLPDEPGGLEVPNRDKLVYNRMRGVAEAPEVERLLPGPERPLPPPELPPELPKAVPAPAAGGEVAAVVAAHGPAVTDTAAAAAAAAAAEPSVISAPVAPSAVAVPPSVEDAEPPAATAASVLRPVARPAAKPGEGRAAADAKPSPSVKTVALDTKLPPPAEAKPPLAGGRFQVQLGAMSSPELAQAQWAKLVAGNPDILGRLRPSIARADLGGKGTFYRLRAGPIDGPERAQQLCKALSGRSVSCIVVSTSG
ncbi:MAG: SPOR domain-containing protein [Rhodospirillales bacterium]|jgi:hypothetical protein|nr:SPOR domain-containing protein [Rhodospirillales bacterium]